jgi:hypothetical protein
MSKTSKYVKKLSKNIKKVVVKKLSKNCQKGFKKLSKSCHTWKKPNGAIVEKVRWFNSKQVGAPTHRLRKREDWIV